MSNSYILVVKAISVILLIPVATSVTIGADDRFDTEGVFVSALILSLIVFTVLTVGWLVIAYFYGVAFYDPYPNLGPFEEPKVEPSTIITGPGPQKGYEVFLEVIVGVLDWVPFEISLLIIAAAFLSLVLSTEGFAQ